MGRAVLEILYKADRFYQLDYIDSEYYIDIKQLY